MIETLENAIKAIENATKSLQNLTADIDAMLLDEVSIPVVEKDDSYPVDILWR